MISYGFGFNGFGQIKPGVEDKTVSEPFDMKFANSTSFRTFNENKKVKNVKICWSRIFAIAEDIETLIWEAPQSKNEKNDGCRGLNCRYLNANIVCNTWDFTVGFENKNRNLFVSDSSVEDFKTIVCDKISDNSENEDSTFTDIQATDDGKHFLIITDDEVLHRSTTSLKEVYDSEFIVLEPLKIFPDRLNLIKIKQVSCGKQHVLILTKIGTVFSFGIGNQGQLGVGSIESRDEPSVIEALEGILVTQISAGGWHSLALTDCGDIYTWGWNNYGQLGLPSGRKDQFDDDKYGDKKEMVNLQMYPVFLEVPKSSNQKSSPLLRAANQISSNETVTTIGQPEELDLTSFVEISCGTRHSLALSSEGEVYSWGWNKYGQLGYKSNDISDQPIKVEFFIDKKVQRIFAGCWNSVVIVDDNNKQDVRICDT